MKALFLFMVSLVLLVVVACENPELPKGKGNRVLESQVSIGFSKSFIDAGITVSDFTNEQILESKDWKILYWKGVELKEQAFKEQNVIKRKVLFHKSLEMILKSINLSPETIEQDVDFYDTVHSYDIINILYGIKGLNNPLVQYLAIQIAVAMGGEIIDVIDVHVSDAYAKRYAELLALEGKVKPIANRNEEAAVTKLRWFLQGFLAYLRGEFDVAKYELEGLMDEYPAYILKEKINRLLAITQGNISASVLVYDFDKIKKLVNRGLYLYGRESKNDEIDKEIIALGKEAEAIAVLKLDADKSPAELFYHVHALMLQPKDNERAKRGRELMIKAIALGVSPEDYPLWDKIAGNGKLGGMLELYKLGILRPRSSSDLFSMKQLMLPRTGEDRGQGYLFVWSADDYGQLKSDEFLNEGIQKISAEINNPDSQYDYKALLYHRSQVFKALGDKENSDKDMDRFISLNK